MIIRNMLLAALMINVVAAAAQADKRGERWIITFSERFRLVSWDNAISLDETAEASRAFTRHRTQLGATWSPTPTMLFGMRMTNEFRCYLAPSAVAFHLDEVFVEHLYVKIMRPWHQPVILTLGRQDIMLGEGFMVMDGHPLDGSRSVYFNALRLDWIMRHHQQVTVFASFQEATDDWLPIIHGQNQELVEQPETGLGFYYTGRWKKREIDVYFIHKGLGRNDAIPVSSAINTIGSRVKQPLLKSIDLSAVAEAGYQFGRYGDSGRRAFGGHGYLRYYPGWTAARGFLPSSLAAGVIYLSGDDPDTGNREGWDPMFARWPKWSESYIYTQIKEDAVAWWTNLISLNAAVQFPLSAQINLRLDYHHLTAPRKAATSADFPGGPGVTRGDLFIGKLSFRIDSRWSGHLLWEGFNPGDYYFDGADSYAWIRAELMYQY